MTIRAAFQLQHLHMLLCLNGYPINRTVVVATILLDFRRRLPFVCMDTILTLVFGKLWIFPLIHHIKKHLRHSKRCSMAFSP